MAMRSPHRRGPALLAGLVVLALAGGTPDASARPVKRSDAVVKVSAAATRPDADGNQTLTLTLDVEKPWHLYANPVANKDLEDNQTEVTVEGKLKPEKVQVEYPAG